MIRTIILLLLCAVTGALSGDPVPSASRHLLSDGFLAEPPVPRPRFTLQDLDEISPESRKSVPLAAIYSLLLPGMGELYVGRYDIGKYFTMAEGGLWLTWGAFQLNGAWVRDDARRFAMQHAGIPSIDGADQYFIDIGNFNDVDSFNEQVLRDRDPQKVYDRNGELAWTWDTPENRESYRNLRVSSESIFNNSQFVIAAVAINHLVSAINAARLAISHNKNLGSGDALSIRANVLGGPFHPHGIMISFSTAF